MSERGGVKVFEGRVYARIRYGQNERFEERLPWASPDDLESARKRSGIIAELCDQLVASGRRDLVRPTAREAAITTSEKTLATIRKSVAQFAKIGAASTATKLTTFKDIAEDWVSGEMTKRFPDQMTKKTNFRLERGRLRRYIYPHVKDVPIAAFEKRHADHVMAQLPPKRVKTPAARRQIAQILSRVMNLAVMPLGLIKATPLGRGWLPRVGKSKMYSCLFPTEERTFLGCKEVDEDFRLFIGILDREGMRISELVDSDWWQWNLEVGTFLATKTKTDDPRMWALRKDTLAAMRVWKERHGDTLARPFFNVASDQATKDTLAQRLRDAIGAAGIDRKELLESTEFTGRLRAHDMRATFVTVSIAEGKSETWIRDRTAHKTTSMIDRYRRTARQFEELSLGSLVDLTEALGWGISWVILGEEEPFDGDLTTENNEGFRRKDSNFRKRNQNPRAVRTASRSAAIADDSDAGDDPPEPGSPTDPPGLRRLPSDVQSLVADALSEAYPHAFGGRPEDVLAPLARAARAIDRGRAPKAKRQRGRR